MILIPDVKQQSIGVFGLGVSGIATGEALVRSGAKVFTWDENKTARAKTANTEYRAEHPKNWPWKEMAFVVVSPGVPLTHPKPHPIVRKARMENMPVIGDVELFARAVNAMPDRERPRVIAVTGSNGKSTTAALIGHILSEAGEEAHVGGNIGEAVLSLPAPDRNGIYVLELSSFQLDLTYSLRANAAVFLNLTPDHIDRHGTIDAYLAAKKRIFHNQTKDDVAIVGVDDDYGQCLCTNLTAANQSQVLAVSAQATLGRGAYVLNGKLFFNFDGKTAKAGDLSEMRGLRGVHNHQNAAAALAACVHVGVSSALVMKAAERFQPLPHRMEEAGRNGKVLFINDSKATNADAAARALSAFDAIYWIVGGKAKEGGLGALKGKLSNVEGAYLIGDAAEQFEEELRGQTPCYQCGDLKTAVKKAALAAARSNASSPVVLLSPACASYDQFKNFEERGETFKSLVSDMPVANGEAA
ncbi:MAG: UDP-N-acetylmuramoylalanine--D-glutamate ligase [Hyphococcus sp.]|nr:MAG: UDP-N-acetylmuramoylalanine--D-glutamate ligase [Marinicaulis sp.]